MCSGNVPIPMITLLNDILQLDALSDIMILSLTGEMLYGKGDVSSAVGRKSSDLWNRIITSLEHPQATEFIFSSGRCLLFQTSIGCLIVSVKDVGEIEKIRSICGAVQLRTAEPSGSRKALLQLLADADDIFKPRILDQLTALADGEVAQHLLPLLEQHADLNQEVRERILLLVCRILGDCSAHQAIPALQKFIRRYRDADKPADPAVIQAARVSIKQLELDEEAGRTRQNEKNESAAGAVDVAGEKNAPQPRTEKEVLERIEKGFGLKRQAGTDKGEPPPPVKIAANRPQQNTAGEESRIKQLVQEGKKQEAAAIIMRYIEAAARQKMFDKAEKLRDKLIEIDSMMLTEIIRAAEIIEEAKVTSIHKDHLATWRTLVDLLTQEEFSALYHAMTLKHYKNGENIVRRGTFLAQLVFVNSGQVQVTAHVNGREIFLKNVEAGEVLGGSTFFEASVWTVDARSLGTELFLLPRRKLELLKEQHPALESKLIDFSAMFTSPELLFNKTNKSRRQFERKSINGRAAIHLLAKDGRQTDVRFKGELFDISRGGVSFFMHVSKKKNAEMLFGNKIRIQIPMGGGGRQKDCTGIIVAVRSHHVVSNEYSVHVRFVSQLTPQELLEFTGGT